MVGPTPVISTVKSNQNVTNINITAAQATMGVSSANPNLRIFQKGTQRTPLAGDNYPTLDPSAASPTRAKSSLSNVSSTRIRTQHGEITYRKQRNLRERDHASETNKDGYSADFANAKPETEDVVDQSFKKATRIVHELTGKKDASLYEKHRHRCLTASEKYNADILKHYNARKSTSVLDFRSEIRIGPKYSDSKSVENLEAIRDSEAIYKKIQHSRSVKSLDFDSDCNSTSYRFNGRGKSVDYASEPTHDSGRSIGRYDGNSMARPTPPKKPLRLSLHKTHSLQAVNGGSEQGDRKSMKRTHKGDVPVIKVKESAGSQRKIRWNYERGLESGLENGSWC